jgi:hypothetical protein
MKPERASPLFATEQTGVATRDKSASIFQPDALLPAQFFDARRRKKLIEPEKRLMLAILEDAVQCFQDNCATPDKKGKEPFDEVQRWIFDVGNDGVFAFESICGVLGFSPDYIRKGLVRWRDKELSKHRGAAFAQRQFKLHESQSEERFLADARNDSNMTIRHLEQRERS